MRTMPLLCKHKTNGARVRAQELGLNRKGINCDKAAQLAEILHLFTNLEESRLD